MMTYPSDVLYIEVLYDESLLKFEETAHCFFCRESMEDVSHFFSLIVQNSKIILNLYGLA